MLPKDLFDGYACDICGRDLSACRAAMDHLGVTDRIRGRLCLRCNSQLGWVEKYRHEINDYLDDPPGAEGLTFYSDYVKLRRRLYKQEWESRVRSDPDRLDDLLAKRREQARLRKENMA